MYKLKLNEDRLALKELFAGMNNVGDDGLQKGHLFEKNFW